LKQVWLVSFLILWFANLFFFGLLIGQFFQGQNPGLKKDLLQNGPTIKEAKIFKVKITSASLQVLDRLDDKWRDLIDYTLRLPKSGLFFRKGTSDGKELVGKKITVASDGFKVGNKFPASNLEVGLPVEIDEPIEDTPAKIIDYRSDPFEEIEALKKASKSKTVSKLHPGKDKPSGSIYAPKKKSETIPTPKEVTIKVNPLDGIRLRGIVLGAAKTAYIENQNKYEVLTIGDSIAGGKVIDITKQNVIIQIGDQQVVLTVKGAK
jgi:hypothetical protein